MTPLDALYRCQRAWEATQPQLFWTPEVLWPDGGLDEGRPGAPSLVEPVAFAAYPPGSGLTVGAEPCHGPTSGLTANQPAVTPAPRWAGSAPLNTTGPDAPPAKGARPAQEVTL